MNTSSSDLGSISSPRKKKKIGQSKSTVYQRYSFGYLKDTKVNKDTQKQARRKQN